MVSEQSRMKQIIKMLMRHYYKLVMLGKQMKQKVEKEGAKQVFEGYEKCFRVEEVLRFDCAGFEYAIPLGSFPFCVGIPVHGLSGCCW